MPPESPDPLRKLFHDLRNDLSPILMHAQLIGQFADDNISIQKSAAAIEEQVQRMLERLNASQGS